MRRVRPGISLEELAGLVCSTLSRHGIEVVLSGGAVVSIYSKNAYQSDGLDFVPLGLARRVDDAMHELGFEKERAKYWRHAATEYLVEFPPGPLTVGREHVTKFAERETRSGTLRLLPPTECVMDRLAHHFHFDDPQAIDQAIEVAKRQRVSLARIEKWARGEGPGRLEKYREFETRLAEAKRRRKR